MRGQDDAEHALRKRVRTAGRLARCSSLTTSQLLSDCHSRAGTAMTNMAPWYRCPCGQRIPPHRYWFPAGTGMAPAGAWTARKDGSHGKTGGTVSDRRREVPPVLDSECREMARKLRETAGACIAMANGLADGVAESPAACRSAAGSVRQAARPPARWWRPCRATSCGRQACGRSGASGTWRRVRAQQHSEDREPDVGPDAPREPEGPGERGAVVGIWCSHAIHQSCAAACCGRRECS
jgi:hypothetical protein